MKVVVIAASLALAMSAAPAFAQAAPGQRPAPRPAAPATSTPAPAPGQAAPAPPAVPVPFPAGAKIAYVNLQMIANQSAEGKALTAKVQALMQKKQNEAQAKQKALADAQQKIQQGGALLSEAAQAALQKDIERMNVEGQRFQQDAQAEINELSTQLQNEFQQKLFPVLDQLVKEHDLHLLLSAADAGIVAGNAGIDLTMEAVRKLDEKTLAGGARPPAPAAATPATAK